MYNRRKEIERLLHTLGVNGSYRGLERTVWAVVLVMEDRRRLDHVTKGLYQEVARKLRTGWKNVEGSIRKVIQVIWNYGGRKKLIEISGKNLEKVPTNTEFIGMLADYLLREEALSKALEEAASSREMNLEELLRKLVEVEEENRILRDRIKELEEKQGGL